MNLKIHKLDFSQREQIISRLKDESKPNNGYFLLIILSVIITTLGLVLNSGAIIIGGMIVSPLLYPIMGVGSAIITGNERFIKNAFYLTLRSSLVAIAGGFLITVITPLHEPTTEILARIQPNLIDLIIALASGTAGAYAVTVKERYVSIMGVAIAASLMPPLAIVGYGFATGRPEYVLGALLLYIANLIAMVVATIAVFYFLGFGPGRKTEKQEEARRFSAFSIVGFVVVLLMLSAFLFSSISDARRINAIEEDVHLFLKQYDTTTKLISIKERKVSDQIFVEISIQSPSSFTQKAVDLLDARIEESLGYAINLQILHIPVTKIVDE